MSAKLRNLLLIAAGTALFPVSASAAKFSCPTTSDEFTFAQNAQIPGLDPHFSSAISTRNIAMNIFEMLITRDENSAIIPQLAESFEEGDDGMSYTFKIRSGITFHNGQTMTSADVLGSLERYRRVGTSSSVFKNVAGIEAPDASTIVITMSKRQPTFLEDFSSFHIPIAIMPASEAEKPANKIDLIGTGPYSFGEWVPDSHVTLKKFDGYVPDSRFEGTTGFGGFKQACFDTITVRIVREASARAAGIESGDYDGVEQVSTKAAARLKDVEGVVVMKQENFAIPIMIPNTQKAPTDNLMVRKAMQAALNMEDIMETATDGAYSLQPGFQYPGNPSYTDAAKELYNIADPDLAKKYLKEAGYNGEEVIIMTNTDYSYMYNAALMVNEQLKDIGMNTKLFVTDWPTTREIRANRPDDWNFYFTGWGTGPSIGPRDAIKDLLPPINSQNLSEEDVEMTKLWNAMHEEQTTEGRLDAFSDMTQHLYEQVYQFKFGDMHNFQAIRSNVKGFVPYRIPRFSNIWRED